MIIASGTGETSSDEILILGAHFTPHKAKEILVDEGEMGPDDSIGELQYGYVKWVENLDEYYPDAETKDGWLLDWSSRAPDRSYGRITAVECKRRAGD